jgi:hypothetical protein
MNAYAHIYVIHAHSYFPTRHFSSTSTTVVQTVVLMEHSARPKILALEILAPALTTDSKICKYKYECPKGSYYITYKRSLFV